MSPEQADSGGEDIDTRTDVYSLGVVLYELLIGALPLSTADFRKAAFGELLRKLRDEDALPPSTKLRTMGQSSVAAQNRRTEPAVLARQLRGDLDAITLKALEKDRSRRYGSPSDLAADIERYLHDQAVLATAPSLTYRTHKFVRRHRWGVAAASALAFALIALALTMAIQSARIVRERDRANREAETARRVTDFLTGLFNVSDPDKARGNRITAREILDEGGRRIETSLSNEPEIQARMLATIGNVYSGLGLYPQAEKLVKQSVAIQQRVLGSDHPDTLTSQRLLGWLETRAGNHARAEKLLRDTLDRQRRVNGPEHTDTLKTATYLADVYYQQARYAEAEKILAGVLETSRRTRGAEHPETLSVMHSMALVYDGKQLFDKEEMLWRQLVDARRLVLGADHPSTITSIQNLAYVRFRRREFADAEKLQREVVETHRRILGPEHPNTLTATGNLANTLQAEGRLGEAEKLQRETLDARRRVLGPNHLDTLYSTNNLALVLQDEGRYGEAEALYREALEGERRILGDNHPDIGIVWYNLAALAAHRKDRRNSLAYLRQALEHGYIDAEFMTTDEAWKSLRSDPEYRALFTQIQQRAADGQRTTAH